MSKVEENLYFQEKEKKRQREKWSDVPNTLMEVNLELKL